MSILDGGRMRQCEMGKDLSSTIDGYPKRRHVRAFTIVGSVFRVEEVCSAHNNVAGRRSRFTDSPALVDASSGYILMISRCNFLVPGVDAIAVFSRCQRFRARVRSITQGAFKACNRNDRQEEILEGHASKRRSRWKRNNCLFEKKPRTSSKAGFHVPQGQPLFSSF